MLQKIKFALRWLRYFFSAKGKHSIHSPFIFNLYTEVFLSNQNYYAFRDIESVRSQLLLNSETIAITDFGAGSTAGNKNEKKISTIAQHAAKQKKYGELLFKLVNYFQPKNVLELGTSLGVSTLYLALANRNINILTIEGCPSTASVATKNFTKLNAKNIQQQIGNFDDLLPKIVTHFQPDFVFIDGNHRKKPTLDYFYQLLKNSSVNSIFIFDDIYWSTEMQEAWAEIKKNEKVSITIDLFFLGIVFLNRDQRKEDFVLRF